ncbi:MAG TPA: type II toxin-antitoxin system RelE/ParE family toxin [Bryobacteraceae bacterium]|nr:type II toxin-antitoxin system RelE/ParE family toxin [Bryobacteraceae bacterium]
MAGSEWTYGIGKSADREISRLPRDLAREAKDTIESLLDDPIPPGSVKLRGYVNAYRVRFGHERYRILYTVNSHRRHIHVFRVRPRPTAYVKMKNHRY